MIGLIALQKTLIGESMILDLMQVSEPYRRHGIVKRLFAFGIETAKAAGAKGLYISACSSEETVAFYKAMGAELSKEPIKEIADSEPFDLQLLVPIL